jgi:hypothetical protein
MEKKEDIHLGIPAEANREKHLNFREAEEKTSAENISDNDRFGSDKEAEERRKQWQQGLEEGRRNANKNED